MLLMQRPYWIIGNSIKIFLGQQKALLHISSSCKKITKKLKKAKINNEYMCKNVLLKAEKLCYFKNSLK